MGGTSLDQTVDIINALLFRVPNILFYFPSKEYILANIKLYEKYNLINISTGGPTKLHVSSGQQTTLLLSVHYWRAQFAG